MGSGSVDCLMNSGTWWIWNILGHLLGNCGALYRFLSSFHHFVGRYMEVSRYLPCGPSMLLYHRPSTTYKPFRNNPKCLLNLPTFSVRSTRYLRNMDQTTKLISTQGSWKRLFKMLLCRFKGNKFRKIEMDARRESILRFFT